MRKTETLFDRTKRFSDSCGGLSVIAEKLSILNQRNGSMHAFFEGMADPKRVMEDVGVAANYGLYVMLLAMSDDEIAEALDSVPAKITDDALDRIREALDEA